MGQEIERKYLVHAVPADLDRWPRYDIRQGYLAISDDVEVRLRSKGRNRFLTVKSLGDLVRAEHEIEISDEQLAALWPATDGRRLSKTRYEIEWRGRLLELDVYHDGLAGLVTVEVELAGADEELPLPPWVGPEITTDSRYKNRNLAVVGLPES
jgi:adenylate cyclase